MKLPSEKIKKIAVFRALQLGDMLNVIPAIRALRAAYYNAEITLISLPWAVSFAERFNSHFDRFISFPGYPGLPEQPFDEAIYQSFLENIKKEHFDLIVQMQGNGRIVNEMIQSWNGKYLAGFYNDESAVKSDLFMPYPNYGSEVRRHLRLMQHLHVPLQGDELTFPVSSKDINDYENLLLSLEKNQYICVHPGSRGTWRQWPPQHFALLADLCAEKGLTVVVTGTADEATVTQNVIQKMKYKAIDLTGKTSLGSMALLIKNAWGLLANCTGVSHIASAMQTPSIIISMDGEPERWSPLNKNIHFVTDWLQYPDIAIPYCYLTHLLKKTYFQKEQRDESEENFNDARRWLSN